MSLSQPPTQCESSMMYPSHQNQHGKVIGQATEPATPVVTPAKRPDTDMDDVQFISSKPVKRQKVDHHTDSPAVNPIFTPIVPIQPPSRPVSQPVSQYQPVPQMDCGSSLITPIAAAPIANNDMSWPNGELSYSQDRRTTTGMVGLPTSLSDWESIFGYRGCSLPELESYNMITAGLRQATISSPAISPKQIPKTVMSAVLQPGTAPGESNETLHSKPTSHPSPNPTSTAVMSPTVGRETVRLDVADPTKAQENTSTGALEGRSEKTAESTPPTPHQSSTYNNKPGPIQEQMLSPGGETSTSTSNKATQSHASKTPCKACINMHQRAALARAQGLPSVNPNMSFHMLPPGPYHPSFGPQAHPQFMSAVQTGMHGFGPGFSPMMMPINMHNYNGAVLSSPVLPQQHAVQSMPPRSTTSATPQHQQSIAQTLEIGRENTAELGEGRSVVQPSVAAPPPTGRPGSSPAKAAPSLAHPSLIPPNYRKPSPNLLVDVAETCQEKFPFEEVAKRHDTTVDKVADVFAAIIQVPLLRCPKDRRRAGRLAHARVKEYNRTKRDLQEAAAAARGQGQVDSSGSAYGYEQQGGVVQPQIVVRPYDIANALGPTD